MMLRSKPICLESLEFEPGSPVQKSRTGIIYRSAEHCSARRAMLCALMHGLWKGGKCWEMLLSLVLLFAGHLINASAAQFTATLDRNTISLGESANLSLVFENGSPNEAPSVPAPPNLVITYLGPTSQFSIVNGRTSSSMTHTYRVTARQPGDYVIPPIQVVVEGKTLSSPALRLKVLKAGDSAAGPGGSVKYAFAKLIAPSTNVYVGEVIPVEIQLFALNPQDLNLPQLKADGFTLSAMNQPTQSRTQIGNAIYQVFTFKVAATAAKTGTLSLGPAECTVALRFRRNRDPADPFADFFGGGIEVRPVTVFSPALSLQVLPLPSENRPENFSGAVGDFEMAVNASPTNAVVGDPITLHVQIAGQGALDTLAMPSLNHWREFTVYPPTSKITPTDQLGLAGVKSFEQVVIPQNAQIKELPSIAFSFFDPGKKIYRTIQQPAIPVSIRPSTSVQPQPTVMASATHSETAPTARDIVHIKPHLGAIVGLHPLFVQRPWFLGLQALPILVWLSALVRRKRQEQLAKDPRLRRRIRVNRVVRNGLRELQKLASENQTEKFYATMFRLLQEQLGEKLDLPAGAITEAAIDDQLRLHGVPEELLSDLHGLFLTCNEARYAPSRTRQELQSLLPKVESVLGSLQALKGGKSA